MTDTYVISETTGKAVIKKDPDAILDYTFDWTAYLADIADTIATKTMVAESPLTVVSSSIISQTVVAFVSGGTVGETHKLTCRITTTNGRTDDRSVYLKIVER